MPQNMMEVSEYVCKGDFSVSAFILVQRSELVLLGLCCWHLYLLSLMVNLQIHY